MKKNVKRFRISNGDWVSVGTLVRVDSLRFDRCTDDTWLGFILPTDLSAHDQKQGYADRACVYGRPVGLSTKAWIVPTEWMKKL